MIMDKKLKAVRKRLYTDFPFYSKSALKIRTKSGQIAPLKLNPAQQILQNAVDKQMAAEGKIRVIILKARQQGLSTYVGGYLYFSVSQNKARKAMVITHTADSTRALFDLTKRLHENCPDILKPHTKYSSRRELSFDVLDSSYIVATAGGDAVGRGETLSHCHASELAFWPKSTAEEIWNGLAQAVPNEPNTAVFIESTANGYNLFYDLWKGAVEGTNGYVPVFIPWFTDPTYREAVPANFERTPDEEELVKEYGLDDEQLMFRRRKVAQNGIELFMQEYPATPDQAFLTSGRPVFNPEQIQQCLENTQDIEEKLALEGEDWVHNHRGELQTYRKWTEANDMSLGLIVAWASEGETIQSHKYWTLRSVRSQLGVAMSILTTLPKCFMRLGCTTMRRLSAWSGTRMVFLPVQGWVRIWLIRTSTLKCKWTNSLIKKLSAWVSTQPVKTKPLVIDQLRASMREGELELNDKTTLREMLTYIVTQTGAMEAEAGCHDDCVMSLALANHVHEGAWTPIEQPEGIYIEMI